MIKILRSKRGEADYITVSILVIVVVMLIALIINVFSIVVTKQKLDMCADQMTRQIQLTGEVNADTQTLFNTITEEIVGITSPHYTVDTVYLPGSKIQLGTAFSVTVTANMNLGGFGEVIRIPLTITSRAAGVSEVYHKID